MNLIFLISVWENFKKFLVSVKNFCVKYWELLVAASLVLVGYFLGRRNDDAAVLREDSDAQTTAANKQRDDAIDLTRDHLDKKEQLLNDYEEKLDVIEGKRSQIIDDLSNNDKKLDNILKDKYNLKKGE